MFMHLRASRLHLFDVLRKQEYGNFYSKLLRFRLQRRKRARQAGQQ
jgi:hypothetical protein